MEDLGMMEVREVQLGMMQDENYAGWGGGANGERIKVLKGLMDVNTFI